MKNFTFQALYVPLFSQQKTLYALYLDNLKSHKQRIGFPFPLEKQNKTKYPRISYTPDVKTLR